MSTLRIDGCITRSLQLQESPNYFDISTPQNDRSFRTHLASRATRATVSIRLYAINSGYYEESKDDYDIIPINLKSGVRDGVVVVAPNATLSGYPSRSA